MLSQNLMYKLHHLPKLSATINGIKPKKATQPTALRRRNFATAPPTMRPGGPHITGGQAPKPRMTTMGGLREFLLHPLTWDRNNGYFNILLGLAIFGYCFCTACHSDGPRTVSYEQKGKK